MITCYTTKRLCQSTWLRSYGRRLARRARVLARELSASIERLRLEITTPMADETPVPESRPGIPAIELQSQLIKAALEVFNAAGVILVVMRHDGTIDLCQALPDGMPDNERTIARVLRAVAASLQTPVKTRVEWSIEAPWPRVMFGPTDGGGGA